MKKKMSYWLLVCVYACLCPVLQAQSNAWELKDIYIRDPFILPDTNTKTYYLYRSADTTGTDGKVIGGVECFRSKDLQHWGGPKRVFTVPENNWITGKVWAPEVHSYAGKYYLFATLNSDIQWKKSVPGWPTRRSLPPIGSISTDSHGAYGAGWHLVGRGGNPLHGLLP